MIRCFFSVGCVNLSCFGPIGQKYQLLFSCASGTGIVSISLSICDPAWDPHLPQIELGPWSQHRFIQMLAAKELTSSHNTEAQESTVGPRNQSVGHEYHFKINSAWLLCPRGKQTDDNFGRFGWHAADFLLGSLVSSRDVKL